MEKALFILFISLITTTQFLESMISKMLLSASEKGNVVNVKQALRTEGIRLDISDKDGNTPLHLASKNGHDDIVEELLDSIEDLTTEEAKALIGSKNKDGNTPLHLASIENHKEVAEELIDEITDEFDHNDAGEIINKKNLKGDTALHVAASKGYKDIVEQILDAHKGWFWRTFVADVNISDKNGDTPLHLAVKNSNAELVKELALNSNHKIDLNKKNNQNETPLDIAVKMQLKEVIDLLRQKQ